MAAGDVIHYYGVQKMLKAGVDNGTFKAVLLGVSTTADTEADKNYLTTGTGTAFTTLARWTCTGYADVTLSSVAVNIDTGNTRIEWDFGDVSFTGLTPGGGGENVWGVLVIWYDTNDANSIPVISVKSPSGDLVAASIDDTINFTLSGDHLWGIGNLGVQS